MLYEQLALASRLSATAPPAPEGTALALVRSAAADGIWAARHGARLPLFALLDVRTALARQTPGGRAQFPDRGRRQAETTRSYDRWLRRFSEVAVERFGSGALATTNPASLPGAAYLPLLIYLWPVEYKPAARAPWDYPGHAEPRAWAEAYGVLERTPQEAFTAWRRGRNLEADTWKLWWPEGPGPDPVEWGGTPAAVPAAVWARFAAGRPELPLHQSFEHAAAAFYFDAADPEPTRIQAARLRRLNLVRAEYPRPTTESVEEQHPFVGTDTLWTLSLGEYGDFKRINQSDPRIAAPPRARTPITFRVYLCWGVGYRAARTLVPARAGDAPPSPVPAGASAAAVLQGLLGLLLDDWRSALASVRVQFALQRVWPRTVGTPNDDPIVAHPGKRWKAQTEEGGRLPPPGVCGLLFRRYTVTELAKSSPTWPALTSVREGPQWWCGALTVADLRDAGFAELEVEDQPVSLWSGAANRLPSPLQHLLVVDPIRATGWVYRIVRLPQRTLLRPVPTTHLPRPSDQAYEAFRLAALDTLLDALLDPVPPSPTAQFA
jgi:hypothetical protein